MDCRPIGWNFIPFLARALGLALSLIALGAEVRADEVDCVIKELQARSGGTNSPSTLKERRELALRLQSQLKAFGVSSEIKSDPEHAGHYLLTLSAPKTQLSDKWSDNLHDRNPLVAYLQRAQALGVTPVYSTFYLLDNNGYNGYFNPDRSEIFLGLKLLGHAELRPPRLRRENPFLDTDIAEHESIHLESDIQEKLQSLLKDVWRDPNKFPKKIKIESILKEELPPERSKKMPPADDYTVIHVSPPNVVIQRRYFGEFYTVKIEDISLIASIEVSSSEGGRIWLRKPGLLYGPNLEFLTIKIPKSLEMKDIPYWYKHAHVSSEVEANMGNGQMLQAAWSKNFRLFRRSKTDPAVDIKSLGSELRNESSKLLDELEGRQKRALDLAVFQAFHVRTILEAGPSAVTFEDAGHGRARLVYNFPDKQMKGEIEIPLESSHGADSESMKAAAWTILGRRLRELESVIWHLEELPIEDIEPNALPAPPQRPMLPPGKSK